MKGWKVCNQCGTPFRSWVVIDGKRRNFTRRKYCTDCSPFGKQHPTAPAELKQCSYCGKQSLNHISNGICSSCYSKNRRDEMNTKAVALLGGACQVCGYKDCIAAFDFHHIDPTKKEGCVSEMINKLMTWDKIAAEIRKCLLLCCRCHREFHAGVKNTLAKVKLVQTQS